MLNVGRRCLREMIVIFSFSGNVSGILRNCSSDEFKISSMESPTKVQVYFTVGSRHETALFNSNTPAEQLKGNFFR